MTTMLLKTTDFISVTDAAEILGCTTGRVRQLLIAKRIRGQKLTERAWAVDRTSVQEYARSDRKPGPKSGVA